MQERVYNFSAGPATMPLPALKEAQHNLLALPSVGASVMEISHRSKEFSGVIEKAESNIRTLLSVPDGYHVLFLQGGASLQFSMAAMNLLRGAGKAADYIITGSWGNKAIKEAKKEGEVNVVFDDKDENYVRTPEPAEITLNDSAPYCYFVSNETIQGVQFRQEPATKAPLVCDMSSDILSRPLDVSKYGIIFAGAQKNLGPSGVAVVIVRDDLIQDPPAGLPSMLDYKVMADAKSLYNTPPTFAIYMIKLVTDWLMHDIGGLEAMTKQNEHKAAMLYEAIDNSGGFYTGHAKKECRSMMNVTWTLPTPEQDADFIGKAAEEGLAALKGHRSVGGLRASIYNAMPVEGVQKLSDFMDAYRRKHS